MSHRKIYITVCLLCSALFGLAQSDTWIVDNNIQSPTGSHIFTDLPAAISAAASGDIIYVKASSTVYTNATLDKTLTIIGEGFNGLASTVDRLTISMDASFSEIYGMKITDQIVFNGSGTAIDLSDVLISHNFVEEIIWNSGTSTDSIRNLTIDANIIGSGQATGGIEALFLNDRTAGFLSIVNNVFYGTTSATEGASIRAFNAFIANNLFVGSGTEKAFDLISNCSVSSNIFFGRSPEALDGASTGNIFAQNYAFGTTDDTFTTTLATIGSDGGGNLNLDPQLLNITQSTTWDFDLFTVEYDYPPLSDPPPIGPSETSFSETGEWLPTIESMSGGVEIPEGADLTLDVSAFIDSEIHDVPTLSQFEYFIDDDPGFGLATMASESPSTANFLGTVSFSTNALTPGFHVIYLRALDQQRWGLYKSYPVYIVDNIISGFDIDGLEYFFDADPGAGLATQIAVSRSNTIMDLLETTDASSLTTGFHNFFIRAIDQHGRWGLPQSNLIYVDNTSPTTISLVQAVEYFFDDDPGYGSGTALTVSTPANTVDFMDAIATTGISTGFHNLFIRAQDDGGVWGLPVSKLVYADPSGATDVANIVAGEFFYDNDPGYGMGASLTIPTPDDTLEVVDNIKADTLSLGFHNLFIRVQDDGGIWSQPIARLLYVDASGGALASDISSFEYFFDVDPGYGAATSLTVASPATNVEVLENLDASAVTTGFHNLFIRAQDDGGSWSLPISKLVYVDASGAGSVTQIQAAEYFFDEDPGYGSATAVDVTDGTSIDELITTAASTLTLGFHNFFIRVQDTGGRWGLPESRLLYVDQAGNVNSDIAEMEYFFDADPGYGLGTSILIDPAEPNPIRNLILDASALPSGNHTLGVRAKNESDVWGVTQHESFISFPPSRELDSVSLIVFYNETDGANWDQNTGWITGSLDTWYGVNLKNNRVDSINLKANNLSGALPRPLGFVDELTYMSLAENILQDTIPSSFADLNKLVTLELHANQFNEIPDLSSIATLENVALDSNFFDFGDLEPLVAVSNYTYENQKIFDDFPIDSTVAVGQSVDINKLVEGVNNTYQWFLNEELIEFGDLEDYSIVSFSSQDTGTYVLRINNTVITDLELETQPFHLGLSDFEEDSLAMVSLYNSLDGANWTDNSSWLVDPLSSWSGLTLQDGRVTTVDLTSNNLIGILPEDLNYADSLVSVNFSDNAIRDTIPSSFESFDYLTSLDVSGNKITSLPNFKVLPELLTLDVSQNKLQFGDLEKNLGIPTFNYLNQDSIGVAADTIVDVDVNLEIERMVSGPNNTYRWLLNGNPITGNATSNTDALLVETIEFADEGNYVLEVNNTQITDLTLYTKAFGLGVSSLERDTKALLALYDATDGDNWTTAVNWTTADITTTPWDGVTLGGTNNDRVTEINLREFGLKDTIPTDIRDITSLQVADLADNDIAAIPNLSGMPSLTSLNLDSNRLVFRYLKPNVGVDGVSYINQKRFGLSRLDTLDAGSPAVLDDFAGINFGDGSEFQWKFGPLVPGQPFNPEVEDIAGATEQSLSIEDVNINSQGTYQLIVTNDDVPGLDLGSRNQNILAKTDFFGKVSLNGTSLKANEAEVVVWRKTPTGPFVKEDSTFVDASGDYILEDVVLGTFVVLVRPDRALPQFESTIQTYYISADTYTEADELLLEDETDGIDIELIDFTPEPVPGTATISGEVISDFDDDILEEGGSRVTSRRKVRKAGCSMRRFKSQGRFNGINQDDVEEEVAYYIETDDEGFFNFSQVADGKYQLSIEFPGVPLSENAEVVFEIGGDRSNQVFDVNVLITEAGIEVDQEEILYTLKPYLKDVNLYPNPTEGVMAMDYVINRKVDDLKMQLVSNAGIILVDQKVDHHQGLHHATIDLTKYESGIYYLIFTDEAGTFAHPIKIGRK
ncbi:MAG: hypothetical protein JXR03_14115 [Cyclobacteriaceae bacterium]